MVEILQILAHLIEDILYGDVDLFHYPLINVPYYLLNYFELLKQFTARLQDILREYVFFTVDPQIWKSFLS